MPKRGRGRWSKRRRVGTEKVTEGEGEHNPDSEKAGAGPSSSGVPFNNEETQGALTNHLILKEVFKHLAVPDLLNFSIVSHFWNSCARTVLRDDKKCVAFIRRDHMCRDLKKLIDLLTNSANIPFNGLSIQRINSSHLVCLHKKYHIHSILKNPLAFYSNLFDMLTFKYFNIQLGLVVDENDNWRKGQCPGEKIMKEIIKKSAEKLEGLSMPYFTDELVSHSLDLNEDDFNFPKLKYLQMPSTGDNKHCCLDGDYSYIGRQLLQASPNVKNITGWVSPSHLEQLGEQNKFDAVREFNFELQDHLSLYEPGDLEIFDSDSEDFDGGKKYKRKYNLEQLLQLSQDCVSSLKNLTKLSISTIHFQELLTENKERWLPVISEIYTGLLSNSSDTLQELKIYQLDLVLLSRLKLPPLPRVRRIKLIYLANLSWTLTTFNWPQVFPNVTSVTIRQGGRHVEREDGDFYITEQMYGRKSLGNESYTWASVTDFTYDGSSDWQHETTGTTGLFEHRLAEVFPNVRSVTLRECNRVTAACGTLWTAWPEVVSIAFLDLPGRVIYKCFDHCFTGMTEDQSSIVRNAISDGKDVSDLIEKYHTRPSIRNLTKLELFRITFFHDLDDHGECHDNSKRSDEFFLTEVTKKCTLDFMPSLNFEIHGKTCKIPREQCGFTFKHLEPNVKLFIT